MREHPFRRNHQFRRAAGTQAAGRVVHFEFDGKGTGCLVGNRCHVTYRALHLFAGCERGLGGLTGLHVSCVEFRNVGRDDDPAVVDKRRDRIAHADKLADFDVPRLQGAIKRCADHHVFEIQLGARQLGPGRLQHCDGFLELRFGDVTLRFQPFAGFVFDLALRDSGAGFGKPDAAVALVQTHDDRAAIDARTAPGADELDPAVGFGGDRNDSRRFGHTVDDDRAGDFLRLLSAHPHAGPGRCSRLCAVYG